MNLNTILSALGTTATVVKAASTTAIIAGAVYLVDCRLADRSAESIDRCWMTALPIMGLGASGRAGWEVGYRTYNPALREPSGRSRDEHGRFTREP